VPSPSASSRSLRSAAAGLRLLPALFAILLPAVSLLRPATVRAAVPGDDSSVYEVDRRGEQKPVAHPASQLRLSAAPEWTRYLERHPGWVARWNEALGTVESAAGPAAPIPGAGLLPTGTGPRVDRAAEMAPGTRWKVVPRDAPLGARGLLGDAAEIGAAAGAPRAAAAVLLLEPDTEGRVAASLARQGEGPAVLYVGLPVRAVTAARARLARLGIRVASGPGPFGSEAAIMGAPASGPTLVLVDLPGARRARRDARRRRGTIKP